MLLLLTNTWLVCTKLALILLQGAPDRRAASGTEDFSMWGTTYKWKWSTLIVSIVVGLVAGALARLLMRGKDQMGFIMTILLAVAGSVVGGIIASLIWKSETGILRPGGLLLSVLGAILLLFMWRRVFRN